VDMSNCPRCGKALKPATVKACDCGWKEHLMLCHCGNDYFDAQAGETERSDCEKRRKEAGG